MTKNLLLNARMEKLENDKLEDHEHKFVHSSLLLQLRFPG